MYSESFALQYPVLSGKRGIVYAYYDLYIIFMFQNEISNRKMGKENKNKAVVPRQAVQNWL